MPNEKTLRDLQVGDTVFVVWQRRRNGKEPPRTSHEVITKVGIKYTHFGEGQWPKLFCRDTGNSHHPGDCNARANGCGFDVYLCESDYLKEQHDAAELKRLHGRLVNRFGGLGPLSPEVVAQIHAALDEAERHV